MEAARAPVQVTAIRLGLDSGGFGRLRGSFLAQRIHEKPLWPAALFILKYQRTQLGRPTRPGGP